MNKKQSWINKYWWAILLSLLILGYFIFVSIINDCCLNRITSDLLNYINLIITPVGVILGLFLGYPLLKKKVVEGYVKKQFDIMDNSNREVRKLCIQLSEKYPSNNNSTRLNEQYINELIEDLRLLHQASVDANRDTYRYVYLVYRAMCLFQEHSNIWDFDKSKENPKKGYNAIYYQEQISGFINRHLQSIYTLATSIGFMPSSEINTNRIITNKLDEFVRDNNLYQIEGLHRSLLYHHSSALLVLFFGNMINSLDRDNGLLMECCYNSAPTASAFARILHLDNLYVPMVLEGEPLIVGMKPTLRLVGYLRRNTISGDGISTPYIICHYANVSDFGFLRTPSKDKSFFKDFKDVYLTKNTFNIDDIEILEYDRERIIVKIIKEKALEYHKKVKRELIKKLKAENK